MKILFVAAEGAPFSKTGGLGDVIGALPKSLVKAGHEVAVILPYYDMVEAKFGNQIEDVLHFEVSVGWRRQYCGIKKTVLNGVTFYFIDNQYYFFRGHVYGDFDDGERFAFFQLAAIEAMERIDFIPDLLHVHDYHTAMIPFLLKEKYRWIQAYEDIETVLTIHNLEFQGQFSEGMLGDLFGVGFERYADGTLRWNNCLNWMKAGILYANRVSTVSPSYAHEIMTSQFGCNLDQILKMESGKVSGIVNGIDADLYNPQTDALLDYHFNQEDLSGKAKNKAKLQERVGLPVRADVPLVGIVSRLTRQKVLMWWSKVFTISCKKMFRLFFWELAIQPLKELSHGLLRFTQTSYQQISLLMSNLLRKSTLLVTSSSCQVVLNRVACLK